MKALNREKGVGEVEQEKEGGVRGGRGSVSSSVKDPSSRIPGY